MRTLGVRIKENPFYAPYDDECWVILAKEIMSAYTSSYIIQFPTTARTQAEFDQLDKQKYAPQRRSILRRLKYGPLRSILDISSIFAGLEKHRTENLKLWGIPYKNNYQEDLDNL